MSISGKKWLLNTVDLSIIGYLADTLVLAIFLNNNILTFEAIIFRLIVFLFITIVYKLKSRFENKLVDYVILFYPFVLLSYIYGETHIFHNIFYSFQLDSWLVNLEQKIFNSQPSLRFSERIGSVFFTELMYLSYLSYYLIIFGSVFWVYTKYRDKSEKFNFVIISSFSIYYLVFIILPAYGPQFYFEKPLGSPPDSMLFGKILGFIQGIGERPTGAFPSSHVGIAFIILLMYPKKSGTFYYSIMISAALILFSTVYIKAHYVVDVIAGIISAPVLIYVSKMLFILYRNFLDGLYHKS